MGVAVLLALVFAAGWAPAWAQPDPVAPESLTTLEQAREQRARAGEIRSAAENRYKEEQQECHTRLLVADCLAGAKNRYNQAVVRARQLEQPAREFERKARQEELDRQEEQRASEQQRRVAEQEEQAARFRAEAAGRAAEREQRLADKARKAEEARQRIADQRARHQAKLDERARADAARAAGKEQR